MSTDIIQRSPEWFQIRLGKVTASRVADIVARTKSGYSASRTNYAAQLVAERLTGNVAESYTNAAMQWGTDMEPEARSMYELMTNATVQEVGFVVHRAIPNAGASPDGLVGESGLVEIKCPNTASHIETLLGRNVPAKYETQMQWQLACTGRMWCDFVSYDPRLPPHMQLFVHRLVRNESRIAELQNEVIEFLSEIDETVAKLNALYSEAA